MNLVDCCLISGLISNKNLPSPVSTRNSGRVLLFLELGSFFAKLSTLEFPKGLGIPSQAHEPKTVNLNTINTVRKILHIGLLIYLSSLQRNNTGQGIVL